MSKRAQAKVDEFADRNGLDDRARSRLHESSDEIAQQMVSRQVGPRVYNPSAYVTRVVRQLEKEAAEAEAWQDEDGGAAEAETWHNEEDLHGETQRGEGYEHETWHDEDQWPEEEYE